jgi:hypothetical protein
LKSIVTGNFFGKQPQHFFGGSKMAKESNGFTKQATTNDRTSTRKGKREREFQRRRRRRGRQLIQ